MPHRRPRGPDHFHTRLSTLTAALRALTEVLDTGGDAWIATTALDVTLYVLPPDHPYSDATATLRRATLDEVCTRLGTVAGYTRSGHLVLPDGPNPVAGVKVHAFTEAAPPRPVLDAAETDAWEMTCAIPDCTNLPTAGHRFCDPCTHQAITAYVGGGVS